jgi:hypothetical protein
VPVHALAEHFLLSLFFNVYKCLPSYMDIMEEVSWLYLPCRHFALNIKLSS